MKINFSESTTSMVNIVGHWLLKQKKIHLCKNESQPTGKARSLYFLQALRQVIIQIIDEFRPKGFCLIC